MKKTIALILMLAMLLSLGCAALAAGGDTAESTPREDMQTPPTASVPAAENAPTAGLPVEEPIPALEESLPAEIPAPAEPVPVPETPVPEKGRQIDFADMSLSLRLPEALTELKGTLSFNGVELKEEDGIRELELDYNAVPLERYDALYNAIFARKNAQPEEIREFTGSNVRIFSVFCVGGGKDFAELNEAYEKYYDMPLEADRVEKIAMDGERSFFLCRHYETDGKTLPEGDYADELKLVISSVDDIVDSLTIIKSA